MTQMELPYNGSPGFKVPGPSSDAAESMKPSAATLRAQCLALLKCNRGGLTADECAEFMDVSVLSARPRLSELLAMGLIVDTGMRRPNASGRMATVWKCA